MEAVRITSDMSLTAHSLEILQEPVSEAEYSANGVTKRILSTAFSGVTRTKWARENLPRAADLAKARGASRAIPLPVSGAFHTPLMQRALEGMSKVIDAVSFRDPDIPVIANTTAQPLTTAEEVKAELLGQLCNGVQWQRSIEYMVDNGVATFIEIGPGRVLGGLIKRINKNVNTLNIGDAESVRKLSC